MEPKKNILATSLFIKRIYDNEDENEDAGDIDFDRETERLFHLFSSNKQLNINYFTVNNFLQKINALYNSNFFDEITEPEEIDDIRIYFCKQLSFPLLCDFVLSFYTADHTNFNAKELTTSSLFDFFVKLGEFYSFIDYLSIEEKVLTCIQNMLVMYMLQLERIVIEENFQTCIGCLDNFFVNVIIPMLFLDIDYTKLDDANKRVDGFMKKYSAYLMGHHEKDFTGIEFEFLDNYFKINEWNYYDVEIKHTEVEVPNPDPKPNDSDSDDDDGYYSVDPWTPTIHVGVPNFEKSDVNFEKYKREFINRVFQTWLKEQKQITDQINEITKTIRIKDYSKFMPGKVDDIELQIAILNVKVALGEKIDFTVFCDEDYCISSLFMTACDYGHLHIVKDILNWNPNCPSCDKTPLDGLFSDAPSSWELVEAAIKSPNSEIFKHLLQNRSKYPNMKREIEDQMSDFLATFRLQSPQGGF